MLILTLALLNDFSLPEANRRFFKGNLCSGFWLIVLTESEFVFQNKQMKQQE
jgi:hypothetical protein